MEGKIKVIGEIYSDGERFDEMLVYTDRKLKQWEEEAAQSFPAKAKILDIGCGKGREAFCLDEKGFQVTGVDISQKVIDAAREITRAHNLDIEFLVSNGMDLPFPDSSFDVVIIWAQTFGLFPDEESRLRILGECGRVLKGDGLLSFSSHNREYLQSFYPDYIKDGIFTPFADSGLQYVAYAIDELSDCAKKAGFSVLSCKRGMVYTQQDGTVLHCLCQNAEKPLFVLKKLP